MKKKQIVTIIGARPQFIKAAVISRLIRGKYCSVFEEYIIHTGQHYDKNMSEVFFHELNIPTPDVNLEIGSGSHGKMTGQMLEGIEKILLEREPDLVLVYGDTNSTLAGALAAGKLNIPIAHVEAGLRSKDMHMPEEQNRILTDHLSSYLFCPTGHSVNNLASEGLVVGVDSVGDIMLDASLYYRKLNHFRPVKENRDDFFLITLHRAENTDDKARLTNIVEALSSITHIKGILPLHPRAKKMLDKFDLKFSDNISVIEPIGFLDMINLEAESQFIVTDSGGVQKEAYFFQKHCITLRDSTEWVETVDSGWNVLVGADKNKIVSAINKVNTTNPDYKAFYGNGTTGESILDILTSKL